MASLSAASSRLPNELLVDIFRWATDNPVRDADSISVLKPFEAAHESDDFASCDAALRTKLAISSSCRLFRHLSKPFFYEDIRIRHGSEAVAQTLEKEPSVALHAKRICIPSLGVPEAGNWLNLYPAGTDRILQLCTQIQVLLRSTAPSLTADGTRDVPPAPPPTQESIEDALLNEPERLDFSSQHFPFLLRADWYNTPFETLPSATRTPPMLWESETLTTLTLGSDYFKPSRDPDEVFVDLPYLHTLRVRSIRSFGDRSRGTDPNQVQLPSLRRIVFDHPSAIYLLFFEQPLRHLGAQIRTLEFGAHDKFLRHDFIMVIIMNCSNTTDLFFPVFTTMPTRKNSRLQVADIVYPIIRLGLSAVGFLHDSEDDNAVCEQWGRLGGHFLSLFGISTRFSKVKTVTLYGKEWEHVLPNRMFKGMLRMLVEKDLQVICEHPEVQRAWNVAIEKIHEGSVPLLCLPHTD